MIIVRWIPFTHSITGVYVESELMNTEIALVSNI